MTYIVDGLVRNLATGIASEAVYDVTVLLIEVGEVGVVHHIHSGIEAHTKINAVVVDYDVGVGFSDSMMPFSMASERYMHALRVIFLIDESTVMSRLSNLEYISLKWVPTLFWLIFSLYV